MRQSVVSQGGGALNASWWHLADCFVYESDGRDGVTPLLFIVSAMIADVSR